MMRRIVVLLFICMVTSWTHSASYAGSTVVYLQAHRSLLALPDSAAYAPRAGYALLDTSVYVDTALERVFQAHNVSRVSHAFSNPATEPASFAFMDDWFRVELLDTVQEQCSAAADSFVASVKASGLGYAEPAYSVVFYSPTTDPVSLDTVPNDPAGCHRRDIWRGTLGCGIGLPASQPSGLPSLMAIS
jgi:hypothetical protein